MIFFTSAAFLPNCTITRIDGSGVVAACLEDTIPKLLESARIAGLSVSIFYENGPVYQRAFC